MRRKGVEKYSDGKKIFSVLVFIIIFLIVSISPKSVKADNGQKYFNYFYINVIHNVLAVTKTSNTNEQHANSEEINTGMEVLSVLGVDILNPISIITKEIAYLDKNEFTTDLDNESKVEKVKEKNKRIVLMIIVVVVFIISFVLGAIFKNGFRLL